jgi:hypothetical protein
MILCPMCPQILMKKFWMHKKETISSTSAIEGGYEN